MARHAGKDTPLRTPIDPIQLADQKLALHDLRLNVGGETGHLPRYGKLSSEEVSRLERNVEEHLASLGERIRSGEIGLISTGGGQFEFVNGPIAQRFREERVLQIPEAPLPHEQIEQSREKKLSHDVVMLASPHTEKLAQQICKRLGVSLGEMELIQFKDGEMKPRIKENVRGREVYIIHSIQHPAAQNLQLLLTMSDALKRASAKHITAVIPYFGYSRQDRRNDDREPITAKLVARQMEASGIKHVITMDIHSPQIEGFFERSFDNLYFTPMAVPALRHYFNEKNISLDDVVCVAPDRGAVNRARAFSDLLGLEGTTPMIDKRRIRENQLAKGRLIGEVKGKTCILADDIADTAGTVIEGEKIVRAKGAEHTIAVLTHPVLSIDAHERLLASGFDLILVSDTVRLRRPVNGKFRVFSSAPIFGEAIIRARTGDSLQELRKALMFDYEKGVFVSAKHQQ